MILYRVKLIDNIERERMMSRGEEGGKLPTFVIYVVANSVASCDEEIKRCFGSDCTPAWYEPQEEKVFIAK